MKTRIIGVFLGLSILKYAYCQEERLRMEHITIENGLSHDHIQALYQDSRGYLWIGTRDGLNRFDGYEMEIYKRDEFDSSAIIGNDIKQIYEDKQKNLWICSNRGLSRYNWKKDNFKNYIINPSAPVVIWSVYEDSYGNFWVATNDSGLYQLDRQKEIFISYFHPKAPKENAEKLFSQQVTCFLEKDNFLYIGTLHGLAIYDYRKKTFQTLQYDINDETSVPKGLISNLYLDSKNQIWVSSELGGGVAKFNPAHKYFERLPVSYTEKSNVIPSGNISRGCIVETSDARLWVGTSNGLAIINLLNNNIQIFKKNPFDKRSLNNNRITALTVDYASTVWIGTPTGLHKADLYNQGFRVIEYLEDTNSIVENNVKTVLEDWQGYWWIGTSQGLNRYDRKNNHFKLYDTDKKNGALISSNITYLYEDRAGQLWVGFYPSGIAKYNRSKDSFEFFESEKDNPVTIFNSPVTVIYEDNAGLLWVGTRAGLCYYDKDAKIFQRFIHDPENEFSLSFNDISDIVEDGSGNLWIATRGGGLNIFERRHGIFKRYRNNKKDAKSLSDDMTVVLLRDHDGRLWVGTKEGGICYFDEKTQSFINYREKDGLASNNIVSLEQDERGYLWIGTNRGLSRFIYETKTFKNYGVKDGLPSTEFNLRASCQTKKFEMLFGTNNGLLVFKPAEILNNPIPPKVSITDIEINYQKVPIGEPNSPLQNSITETKELFLDYEHNTVTFLFSAFHFARPEQNQYAYQLEGFDKGWVYTSSRRRFAGYTHLEPGKYIFKLKASNNDGLWTEQPVSLTLHILPPFWQTWWFKTFLFILFGVISYLSYKAILNRMKRQRLEKLVEERTKELLQKNEQIQIINEQLKAQSEELLRTNERINQQNEEMRIINETLVHQKAELEEKNEQILVQRDQLQLINLELAEQKKEIEASIRYAKTMQDAILPSLQQMTSVFPDSFLIFLPRDIVSGDFYWFSQIKPNVYAVAVVDCTGHGVPGAFMSLVGHTALKEIIVQRQIHNPSLILEELNTSIRTTLKQDTSTNDDGMDIAFCIIEKLSDGTNKVLFSGAKRPLFYFHPETQSLEVVHGDNKSIGGMQRKDKPFQVYEFIFPPKTILYLFSDGLPDQNNIHRQKFTTQNFKELLASVSSLDMRTQKERILFALKEHQGKMRQRDDITVIGIRL
ncbi:MAG: SpoIIE family protein phosphatase [Cytophagales bacterium]|nr:SpoIIE family protein phosphatase [Cytophagales bacterium]MDW8383229.1 two-component regulator propeller domain-containing protein [Flammeovirgaceae bacterium]